MTLIIAPTARTEYTVEAGSLADVVDLLMPRSEAGECSWSPSYSYEDVTRKGYPVKLRLRVTITIEMPKWIGRSSATRAERKEWDRFWAALLVHEKGHERIARKGFGVMHATLVKTMVKNLEATFQKHRRRIQSRSDSYDSRTDHGRKPPPGTIITVPASH